MECKNNQIDPPTQQLITTRPLIAAIVITLHDIVSLGLPTKLSNIWGHINIKGNNDLADTAANLVVISFDDNTPVHKIS